MSEEASIVRETGGDGKPCKSECETGSSLVARNRRVSMPWERQVRARPSVASHFAEPMLGRFDSAVCARPMEQPVRMKLGGSWRLDSPSPMMTCD